MERGEKTKISYVISLFCFACNDVGDFIFHEFPAIGNKQEKSLGETFILRNKKDFL